MTNQRIIEIAQELAADLEIGQTAEFATALRTAIENRGYTPSELEELDDKLLTAGVDVNPICRKKHPTT